MDRIYIRAARLNDPLPDSGGGKENGPFYTKLGAAQTPQTLRSKLADQFGCTEEDIRMIGITLTGYEGAKEEWCPAAKWVIGRSNHKELYIVVFKVRMAGRTCDESFEL